MYTLYLATEQAIGLKFAQRKIETWSDDIRCYLDFANPITYRLEYNETQIMKDNLGLPLIPSHPNL